LESYKWDTVSVDTLGRMRTYAGDMRWIQTTTQQTETNIDSYFFNPAHWIYTIRTSYRGNITVEGQTVGNYHLGNANFLFEYFLTNGKGIGVSTDMTTLVDAFLKSVGIASTAVWQDYPTGSDHPYPIFYAAESNVFSAREGQLEIDWQGMDTKCDYYIFRPPVNQHGYPGEARRTPNPLYDDVVFFGNNAYRLALSNVTGNDLKQLLTNGIPMTFMKRFLFYL